MSIPYSRYLFYPLPWYSFLIVLGVLLAVLLASGEEKRLGLPKDTILDLALWAIPFGILGARIYYVLFSWDSFKDDLLSVLKVWEGGIAIYGAVIAGLLVVFFFCGARKLPMLTVCDAIVPGLALAQCIGRWGNYFNMEAYGLPLSNPAFCFFPLAVRIPAAEGYEWHMASFFYESVLNLLIFVFLMTVGRKKLCRPGDSFFFYLFLYGAGRLVVEETRMDSLYSSGIRVSQLLAALICLFVLVRYTLIAARERRLTGFFTWLCLTAGIFCSSFSLVFAALGHLWGPLPLWFRLGLPALSSVLMTVCLFRLYFSRGGMDSCPRQD